MDMNNMHWAERLAFEVAESKKPPFVISSGITTSGPAHLGTLCEFLYPSKIRDMLVKNRHETKFYFMADIMDAFDSIPLSMKQYEKELTPHLGKPLAHVPDPTGKSRSFGDHFLDEVIEIMGRFEIEAQIVRMNELYASGKPDKYAKLFLENEKQAKEIVERTSGKEEKKDWSPIMPICGKCGKIATTRVLSHDTENYEYACDRDVKYTKGCGFIGKDAIGNHHYKITWRLHWPMWQDLFGTSCEGAGMDHFTKGGSRDTLETVFREMFKKEPPIGYKYGFILFQGKKYSKSKGIGMGVSDLMGLLPPEVITFVLTRPDLGENKDISPGKDSLLRMMEEYEQSQEFAEKGLENLDRAGRKRAFAYILSGKRHWNVLFKDVLMYHSIYLDWAKTGEMLGDAKGMEYLKTYVEEWITKDYVPDEYNFKYQPKKAEGNVKELMAALPDDADALAIHNAVFNFAKERGIVPAEFFKQIYLTLIGKEKGPRLGKLIFALG
ncbi:MAG: lysine--tRNA ligase, partial [Candidatus ainarchaeum sp.]|nr:lysine--tRNA ligase [Candidatus ainarchaeum sp.]